MDEKISLPVSAETAFARQYQRQLIRGALKSAGNQSVEKSDSDLHAACAEMESLFISYLFKEMRATIDKSGFISGGRAEDIFTSMMDAEISREMSTVGGIGLSTLLMDQLGDNSGSKSGSGSK